MEKNKKRMGLGRGLGSLLAEKVPVTVENSELETNETNELLIDFIETNPFQPRTNFDQTALNELKDSILIQGIIQPITVRKISGDKYQLISGERRLQASKLAGLSRIPAYIREVTDNQMLEMGLIENIQRENLNPMEIAMAYQRLITDCKLKQEELGKRVGKDRTTVNNFLRLLNLPKIVQDGLNEKKLSMSHARALLGLAKPELIEKTFQTIVQSEMSVRKVEELVRQLNGLQESKNISVALKRKEEKVVLTEIQDKLAAIFKQKVAVVANKKSKGEIKIAFSSKIELDDILNKLKKKIEI